MKKLIALNIFLLLSFFLGLFVSQKKTSTRPIKTAVLNKNYVQSVSSIYIRPPASTDGAKEICLLKKGDLWLITYTDDAADFCAPVFPATINGFIEAATSVIDVYLCAESEKSFKNFALSDEKAYRVTFLDAEKNILSELYFGKRNQLSGRTAFRSYAKQNVYETAADVVGYAQANVAFWTDPFVFPQYITDLSRAQSERFPRHGKLLARNAFLEERGNAIYVLKKEFENGSRITLNVFSMEDFFVILPEYTAGFLFSANEKEAVRSLSYAYQVSEWTLEQIKEEVEVSLEKYE